MNKLLKAGLFLMIVSGFAAVWGYWYVNTHGLALLGELLGQRDPVYNLAWGGVYFGGFACLVGIVMIVIGAVQSSQRNK